MQRLRNNQPYKNLSTDCPEATIADAYALQRAFVQALAEAGDWGAIAGYKAALTAPQAQKMMGVAQPVIGVLFSNGERPSQHLVQTDRPVMLETELGFRLNAPITHAVDEHSATGYVGQVAPMVELAAPHLQQRPNGVDLIASNSATYGYITGNPYQADWHKTEAPSAVPDLDGLNISLFQKNDLLHAEVAGSIMEGQWQALTWLINEVLAQGYVLSAEHLLMTGSVGALHPAKPGEYRSDHGPLGCIEFQL